MKSWLPFSFGLPAALLGVLLSGAASADGFFVSPAKQSANSPDVGIDGHGNAVFSWTTFTQQGILAQIKWRSAGGALAGTQTLSKTGHDAQSAHIAVSGGGTAVAVWQATHGDANTTTPIEGRARSASGALSPIFAVAPHPGGAFSLDFANPNVAIDGAGNATFTWIGLDSNQKKRAYARRRAANGSFGPTLVLSPDRVSGVVMAVNAGSTAVFAWVWNDGAGSNLIEARRLSATGVLGPTKIIGKGIEASGGGAAGTLNPQVGLDSHGNALIVWEQPDGKGACGINGCPKILSRTLSSNNVVGTVPQTFSTTVDGGRFPQVAMDKNGNAVVTWLHAGLEFRTRTAAGTLGPVRKFSTSTHLSGAPQLKGDPAGNTVAVWQDGSFVRARSLSAAGVLGTPRTYSIGGKPTFSGAVAVGTAGDAVVAWGQSDGLGQCSGGSSCNRVGGAVDP